MTMKDLLTKAGFAVQGEGAHLQARGMFLGYPTWFKASGDLAGDFAFYTTADIPKKVIKALNKEIAQDPLLKGSLVLRPVGDTPIFPTAIEFKGGFPAHAIRAKLTLRTMPEEMFNAAANTLQNLFNSHPQIFPQLACPICNEPEGDTLMGGNYAIRLVHTHCFDNWHSEQEEAFENREFGGGYLGGLLLGALGGIVGALPALLALVFTDYFVWVLFALIPLGVTVGYNLSKAKRGTFVVVFTILYSIAVSLLTTMADVFFALRREFYDVTVGLVLDLYLDWGFFSAYLLRHTALALVAALVGVAIAWQSIKRTDKGDKETIATVMAEAAPVSTPPAQTTEV